MPSAVPEGKAYHDTPAPWACAGAQVWELGDGDARGRELSTVPAAARPL